MEAGADVGVERGAVGPDGADVHQEVEVVVSEINDGMGWHAQGDGKYFYGLNVENGRIKDEGNFRMKTALREVCRTLGPPRSKHRLAA